MVKPLFILSLPRSGSTLLQRVLAADRRIVSVAEPWVLLPFVYALREQGIRAEYSHQLAHMALNDFLRELPDGRQDYLAAIRTAMSELYQKATKDSGARYFLDKTPRYALIADEIFEMFPEEKVIFLWRNPLSIIASIIETWGEGQWNVQMYDVDLFTGLSRLIDAYQAHSENALAVKYESFVLAPEKELFRIQKYLEIQLDSEVLRKFSQVQFKGQLGDPTGSKQYKVIDPAPLNRWRTVINNPLRRMWCRRYLNWLGKERLKVMGYDLSDLHRELDSAKMSWQHVISDGVALLNMKNRTANFLRGIWRGSFSPAGSPRL